MKTKSIGDYTDKEQNSILTMALKEATAIEDDAKEAGGAFYDYWARVYMSLYDDGDFEAVVNQYGKDRRTANLNGLHFPHILALDVVLGEIDYDENRIAEWKRRRARSGA